MLSAREYIYSYRSGFEASVTEVLANRFRASFSDMPELPEGRVKEYTRHSSAAES